MRQPGQQLSTSCMCGLAAPVPAAPGPQAAASKAARWQRLARRRPAAAAPPRPSASLPQLRLQLQLRGSRLRQPLELSA